MLIIWSYSYINIEEKGGKIMKHIAAWLLAVAMLLGLLTACAPREATDPTDPVTAPPETIVEPLPVESLPGTDAPDIDPEITPAIPLETFPEKPDSDYSIPPGETPGSNAVDY